MGACHASRSRPYAERALEFSGVQLPCISPSIRRHLIGGLAFSKCSPPVGSTRQSCGRVTTSAPCHAGQPLKAGYMMKSYRYPSCAPFWKLSESTVPCPTIRWAHWGSAGWRRCMSGASACEPSTKASELK